MSIRIHMSSDEILEMFGPPDNITVSTCGTDIGEPWTCTTWNYGVYNDASFTFYEKGGLLYLNSYDVDSYVIQ